MYLLDTNVISELRKPPSMACAEVLGWAAAVPIKDQFLSAITVMELEIGVLLLERYTPLQPPQGARLRLWLTGLYQAFAGRILPVTAEVAVRCATLHVPDRRSDRDALIAATALENGLRVVTRNVADFSGTGVGLINPWAPNAATQEAGTS